MSNVWRARVVPALFGAWLLLGLGCGTLQPSPPSPDPLPHNDTRPSTDKHSRAVLDSTPMVGRSLAEIRALLGEPDAFDGPTMLYAVADEPGRYLVVRAGDDGIVHEVVYW